MQVLFHLCFVSGIIDSNYSEEWKRQRTNALQILRDLGWGKNSIEERIKEECEALIQG